MTKHTLVRYPFQDETDTILISQVSYEFFTRKPKRFSTKSAARKLVAALWFVAQEGTPRVAHTRYLRTINPTKG